MYTLKILNYVNFTYSSLANQHLTCHKYINIYHSASYFI